MGCMGIAIAQPTNLGQIQLEITDKYKAKIRPAERISTSPKYSDTNTAKMDVNYKINSQGLDFDFSIKPLPAARISKVPVTKLTTALVKLGFGLYNSPLAEVYWNSKRSSEYSLGLALKHYSTQTGVQDIVFDNNPTSLNSFDFRFDRYFNKFTWETKASASFNKHSFYGVPLDIVPMNSQEIFREPNSIWRRELSVNSIIKEKKENGLGVLESLSLSYYNNGDNYKTEENEIQFDSDWSLAAGDLDLKIDLNASFQETSFDSLSSYSRNALITQVHPYVKVPLGSIVFDFGLNFFSNTYSSNQFSTPSTTTDLYFIPEVRMNYPIVDNIMTAYAGFGGELVNNNYRSMSNANPYFGPGSDLRASFDTKLYAGLKGILSSKSSFMIEASYNANDNLMMSYRDPLFNLDSVNYSPELSAIYDRAKFFRINGLLDFNINSKLKTQLYGQFSSYQLDSLDYAFNLPNIEAGVNFTYLLKEKIRFNSDMSFIGTRTAFNSTANTTVESELDAFFNWDLGIQYFYNSRLSIFLNTYNLTNSQFDKYLGYRAQSIQFLTGITYKF